MVNHVFVLKSTAAYKVILLNLLCYVLLSNGVSGKTIIRLHILGRIEPGGGGYTPTFVKFDG